MSDHLLFIDTETSGLPKNWAAPVSRVKNWPRAVQVSWIIFDCKGNEISRQDHFIRNDDIIISKAAMQVHGITPEYLKNNGQDLETVLKLLDADLRVYKPRVMGHFVKLDYLVLSAEYFRLDMPNPLSELSVFCTMQATRNLVHNPWLQQLRLNDLYSYLFHHKQPEPHNAIKDAEATARCFFELLQRGEITEDLINQQNNDSFKWRNPAKGSGGWVLVILLILLLFLLILFLL